MLSALSATPQTDHLFKRSIYGLPFFLGLFRILQAVEYLRGLRRAAGDDGAAPRPSRPAQAATRPGSPAPATGPGTGFTGSVGVARIAPAMSPSDRE